MIISGLDKLTLLDYTGKVASIVFTGGCNFRCPYCHNGEMVKYPKNNIIAVEEVYDYLKKRVSVLDGVVISGGEPLIHEDIDDFMADIKELGYAIKLDTNGSCPEHLKKVIDKGLVDYVAMDIKGAPDKYGLITGRDSDDVSLTEKIKASVEIIMSSGVDYEFRTTYVKGLHDIEDAEEIGKLIRGAKRYFVQNYKESDRILVKLDDMGGVSDISLQPFEEDELKKIRNTITQYVGDVKVR
ncbi:MAG: anaerobic ribonucleoside-triphosphate reductase activating protein [Lachnospiraceae bacterium]|nr:anaerobic ribonucleoside-triphosphate reductase activating protein [Lachnospiraceae bacterium]